jgi:hypothetical protein
MSWNIKTPGDYINGPLTVAGSATITGNLTVDTSTLKVDSTNDRVGIGTATPSSALHVNLAEVSSAAGTSAIITNTTGGGNRIAALRLNNLSNNWHIRAVGAVTDDLRFGAGVIGSEVDYLTVNTSGNVTVSTGNVVMGTSGKGIDFSATAGTGTSELLNDYEEGTWVPTQGSGLTVVGAFSSSGTYTKVGRLVTIVGRVNGATSVAATSGNILCGGLPFTGSDQAAVPAFAGAFTAGAFCAINLTEISSMTAFGPTASIRFSATYQV